MRGIFGGPAGGQQASVMNNNSMLEESPQYKGLLPNLNSYPTKKDGKLLSTAAIWDLVLFICSYVIRIELEQEIMNEINQEAMRREQFKRD